MFDTMWRMIRHLTGTVIAASPSDVILDVNGVGYLVFTTKSDYRIDSTASFWTYLAVRETALDLFGFATRDELDVFILLLTLPKIGPKSAAGILAQADIELLKKAVREEDATYLSKMSGIGKKSAEKIVLGLKEKLDGIGIQKDAAGYTAGSETNMVSDTIDALISLGYPHADARRAVQQLPADIENANDAVRAALKLLSN